VSTEKLVPVAAATVSAAPVLALSALGASLQLASTASIASRGNESFFIVLMFF
jgi:hypothetical protein